MMLQPFEPRIPTSGEVSVIVLSGEISHAVLKRPRPGEFRVQPHFGGETVPIAVEPEHRRFVEHVRRAVGASVDYARVDFVAGEGRPPVLMELELIEPDLFLRLAPNACAAYADMLLLRAASG